MCRNRITLKDIAVRCGVTPTVVSAVLNHRHGRISCSPERRSEILRMADDLGYRPNLLARSMVVRRVPLVGIMLHLAENDFVDGSNQYFMQLLPGLTFRLNHCGLEALFIPYSDAQEQLRRLDNLVKNSLLGGVVTNIIPHADTSGLGTYLKKAELPYMILGCPNDRELYHAFAVTDYPAILGTYLRKHTVEQIYLVIKYERKLKFLRYPFPDNYFWLAQDIPSDSINFVSERNLFVLSGISILESLQQQGIRCRHKLIIESQCEEKYLPEGIPCILVDSDMSRRKLINEVTDRLVAWMEVGRLPESAQLKLTFGTEIVIKNQF